MTRITTRSSSRVTRSQSKDGITIKSDIIPISDNNEDDTVFRHPPRTPRKYKSTTLSSDDESNASVSPPKQKKIDVERFSTPTKVKGDNDNVFSKPETPSTLLRSLTLSSPDKRQGKKSHKKLNFEKRRLDTEHSKTSSKVNENVNEYVFIQPDTPSTLLNDLTLSSPEKNHEKKSHKKLIYEKADIYQDARRALHSTFPVDLPGREKELKELRNFINNHVEEQTSGTLYVSGPPGTGKTASLNLILEHDEVAANLQQVYINCTAIKSAGSVYSRIVKELRLQGGRTENDNLKTIENYLTKSRKMILLILDEIDQLESKNQSVLYTIFEWPSRPNSKLILIGIANALDLTDRILPRLQARCELKPTLMHFASYSKQQIVEILTSRLKEAGALDVFTPVALQMLAGKVAAISGDIRRALDIARRLIELVDRSRRKEALKSIENLASELIENENNENHVKSVNIKEVVDVLNNVYGTSQNLSDESEDAFPLQQKIVICSLLLMLNKAKNKDVTVGKLHEVYRKVCSKKNLMAVDQAEFVGICALIETKGIIRIIKKKEPRLSKVNLEWDEEEVSNALKDKQLMSTILQDTTCLGKL